MSRHPKASTPALTKNTCEVLCAAIRRGAYLETAVALAGISKDTFYRWMREATKLDCPAALVALSDAVKKAMADAELRDLDVIDAAAQRGEWQAAAWRLERKHPDRWGRRAPLQVEHEEAAPKVDLSVRRQSLRALIATSEGLAAIEVLESTLPEDAE